MPLDLDRVYAQLLNSRDEGVLAGVEILSRMTVDWEELGWSAVRTGVKTTLSVTKPSMGKIGKGQTELSSKNNEYAQNILLEPVGQEVSSLLEKVAGKAIDRIGKSKWFARAKHVVGIGFEVIATVIKNMITSIPVVEAVVPFWGAIKGGIKTIDSAIKAFETKGHLAILDGARDSIGAGVPAVAMDGLMKYVNHEMLLWAGKAAYTFGKTLANVLLTALAAPAATVVTLVTSIVEAVYTFVSNVVQAFCFDRACNKCREYLLTGRYIDEFADTFSSIVASCPLIGAFFFALKSRIGGINLTCMLQNFEMVVADSSLQSAMATKVWNTHVLACHYITKLNFKPKARPGYEEDVSEALEQITAVAAHNTPEPEMRISKPRKVWNLISRLAN